VDTNRFPADAAPRSYLINGWSDYFQGAPSIGRAMPEAAVHYPSETIAFGEKESSSGHFYFDYWVGDDFTELENARHARISQADPQSGGSNFAFVDGSVRFLRFGRSLSPVLLWMVTDEFRNNGLSRF